MSERLVMSWDHYFIQFAELAAKRSPDPDTQHGCVLVSPKNRIISIGYNGPVQGLDDKIVPRTRPDKYNWFVHAEDNAVLFAERSLEGATAYVTGHPCAACLRRFLQAGIVRIVYGRQFSQMVTKEEMNACRIMCEQKKVSLEAF